MSESELQPGTHIGNYILQELIGEGGFAQVWKAVHHERPGRVVAVKIAVEETYRRQLSHEGRLPDIDHPNVVPILDSDTRFSATPYIVMPFLPGGSLADLIAKHPQGLPEDRVEALLLDILAGLAAAHAQGIVHRDIKPSNVLLDGDGKALISDFGLSLLGVGPDGTRSLMQSTSRSLEQNRTLAGTLTYMAPEVLGGHVATPAADVYSVGITLFEMLVGRRPAGVELPSQRRADLRRAKKWNELYGHACCMVEERYSDAGVLAQALGGRAGTLGASLFSSVRPTDPEKMQVKVWAIEQLRVELERIEVAQPTSAPGLPPVPEAALSLRSEVDGLMVAIAQLKDGTHPSLKQAQAAISQAEAQLRGFQEDLAANDLPLPQQVRADIERVVETRPNARASEFCEPAPAVTPAELLPFVARLRNVRRARQALEAVRRDLAAAVEGKVRELGQLAASKVRELQALEEDDLRRVLKSLRCGQHKGFDLVEAWSTIEPQLAARGYLWTPLALLKKVELHETERARRSELRREVLKRVLPIAIVLAVIIIGAHMANVAARRDALAAAAAAQAKRDAGQAKHDAALAAVADIRAKIETGQYHDAAAAARAAVERFPDTPAAGELRDLLGSAGTKWFESLPKSNTLGCGNAVKLELVLIPPGTFMMGPTDGRHDEEPLHLVTVSQPFYLGKYEVTQSQWATVMGSNPSISRSDSSPVENVSWDDCQDFCKKLSAKTGKAVRLPTEAEWEYACRAGNKGMFCFGDEDIGLGEYAWFDGNSDGKTHPVGLKKPNDWGLHDMHGNVREWCADWDGSYRSDWQTDPAGPSSGAGRVLRGGSWSRNPTACGSAFRGWLRSDYRSDGIGLRVAVGIQ